AEIHLAARDGRARPGYREGERRPGLVAGDRLRPDRHAGGRVDLVQIAAPVWDVDRPVDNRRRGRDLAVRCVRPLDSALPDLTRVERLPRIVRACIRAVWPAGRP